jgi:hypothetical protein
MRTKRSSEAPPSSRPLLPEGVRAMRTKDEDERPRAGKKGKKQKKQPITKHGVTDHQCIPIQLGREY